MTLAESSNGPIWVLWIVCAVFAVISIVLLSGHGAGLIAGYNTASEEQKKKTDPKKLCRVVGGGMAVITVLLLVMAVGANVLPASFEWVFVTVTLADCAVMVVLANTICRK